MRLLLDTHTFLWWLTGARRLGPQARRTIAEPENVVFVSAATAWEIAVKRAAGKLDASGDIGGWIEDEGFVPLGIDVEHAVASAELPPHHSDPFDRLLVAQARLEELALVARDDAIDKYDVTVIDASR
jgi:PIN domain nuclease of toxin-antitoxin system